MGTPLRISPRLYRDNIGHSYGIYFHSQLTAFECELRRLCITHPSPQIQLPRRDRYLTNFLDTLGEDSAMTSSTDTLISLGDQAAEVNQDERRVLDKVGEALARLGRVKRVGLTLKDKVAFVDAWSKRRK